ncbi:NAD(P)-binding protein [Ramaria rubella]|nr:NAD(P)-binding protein [Ramaria rubella]
MSKSVFITGATGYIGGATLSLLLESPTTKSFSYSALVRNKNKAVLLESLGVRPVLGSLGDATILADEAEKADIVIHTADSSDHVPSCKAILEGMQRRSDKPILIHISGTGTLRDDARGEYPTDNIYSDLDPDHINSLPDDAFHRNVDLLVLAASPKVRTHIVLPPTIFGVAENLLVKKGIANPVSKQLPEFIGACVARGQTGVLGKGANIWPFVHIEDIATAILAVFEAAIEGRTATGREGYYFGETGEYTHYDVARELARTLHARGIGTAEPTPFSAEDMSKYWGGSYYVGTNSRCRAERTRQLGWKSVHKEEEFLQSIGPEVDFFFKQQAENK